MARDRDVQDDRFFEGLFYGTPTYALSRTPDGRIVSELSKGRKEDARRHSDTLSVQRDLVSALKGIHGGSNIVPREDFDQRGFEMQGVLAAAAGQLGALNRRSEDLLEESRVLNRITQHGFDDLGGRVDRTTDAVHGVESAVHGVQDQVFAHRTDAYEQFNAAQGPAPMQQKTADLIHDPRRMVQVLAAHQNGLLSESARRDLERLLDSRLSSRAAQGHVSGLIETNIEDRRLKREVRNVLTVIEQPSRLINGETRNDAIQQVRRLEQIAQEYPNKDLEAFITSAYALMNMSEQARNVPIDQDLLVDLTNNHLVVDAVSHEVKKRNRGARMDGSAVDRNFNLIELLEQGDRTIVQGEHAAAQRERMVVGQGVLIGQGEHAAEQREHAAVQRERGLEEMKKHTALGVAVVVGQGRLLEQGAYAVEQRQRTNEHLADIADGIIGTNRHLVNLEELATEFIETVDQGFSQVKSILQLGFNMELEALDTIATQIAISRAATLSQLRELDATVERVGANIQIDIQHGNAQLERLVALTEDSLGNVSKQRLRQGTAFLRTAEVPEDFREALRLFMEGIKEDPTVIGNQYGAAVSAEALGEDKEAMPRYRTVGKMADRADLASAAWTKHGELKAKEGELPEAVQSLKNALEKDKTNSQAKYLLARSLSLSGFVEEAVEVGMELIEEDIFFIYKLKLDGAFSPDVILAICEKVWKLRLKLGAGRILKFIFDQFIELNNESGMLEIINYYLEYGPQLLLKEEILDSIAVGNVQKRIGEFLADLVAKKPQLYTSEAWYAFSCIGVRIGLEDDQVVTLFKEGLKEDINYHKERYQEVKEAVQRIAQDQTQSLVAKLVTSDSSLTWLIDL